MADSVQLTDAIAPNQPSDAGLRSVKDLGSLNDVGELAGAQLPEAEEAVAVEASNGTVKGSGQQQQSNGGGKARDQNDAPAEEEEKEKEESYKDYPLKPPSLNPPSKDSAEGTTTTAAPVPTAPKPVSTTAPTRAPSLSSKTAAKTFSASTDGLVLYDLTSKKGGTALFSPHTTKTILDLKLLGVGYDRQRRSFVQIRTELAERVAQNVTVPTLELSDGTHLSESWTIAEFLETNHPSGHLIFGGSTPSKALAATINQFCKSVLAPSLGALSIPGIARILDAENRSYFEIKIGQPRYGKLMGLTREEQETYIQQAINHLAVVETTLAAEPSALEKDAKRGSPWLAKGEQPTHADFCLFGWYVYTRASGRAITRQIWESAPHLKKWKNEMLKWAGEDITRDLLEA